MYGNRPMAARIGSLIPIGTAGGAFRRGMPIAISLDFRRSTENSMPATMGAAGAHQMAAPIGIGQLTPSQKVQERAKAEQREEEEKTVGQHKEEIGRAHV